MTKCLICRRRMALGTSQAGFTCTPCTDFLTKLGHQFREGEGRGEYLARVAKALGEPHLLALKERMLKEV